MYWINKIIRKLQGSRLPGQNATEASLIEDLQQKMRLIIPPDPSTARSDAERAWARNRRALREDILQEDPRGLISFPTIRNTMFVDDPPFVFHELAALRKSDDWGTRWKLAIEESARIPAPPSPHCMQSSGNLIHYAFHVHQFELATGMNPALFGRILEFGGGYGGMCRLIHRLGFETRYFIFDLPEFSALQEFYLRANAIHVQPLEIEPGRGATCFSDFAQFQELNRRSPPDLFIALWSLSETPLDFRQRVLDALTTCYALIAYQDDFESINNSDFFAQWCLNDPRRRWATVPATHLPDGNFYLFGMPKGALNGNSR